MKRMALIIVSPNTKYGRLPGAAMDAKSTKQFLETGVGGAWEESEIKVLSDPSKYLVEKELGSLQNHDYVIVSFSGHGEHVRGAGLDETHVCLNDNEDMSVFELNPRAKRQLVIIDACRTLVEIRNFSEITKEASLAMKQDVNRDRYREAYEAGILQAEEGRVVMYSCGINQSAGENANGGYFTTALINEANSWAKTTPSRSSWIIQPSLLNCNDAFELAKRSTYARNAPQSPVFEPGRRMHHFPFAVSLK